MVVQEYDDKTSMPNHKVLILFPSTLRTHDRVAFLSTIFQEQYDEQKSIFRDVQWKTKYYKVNLDLYVDNYMVLEEWINEFLSEECRELREVLSGVIFVLDEIRNDSSPHIRCIKRLLESMDEDIFSKFFVGCNFAEDMMNETSLDDLNSTLMDLNLEVVNWIDKTCSSMEKAGPERIKEILDIYQWSNMDYQREDSERETDPRPNTVDMNSFISRLDEAKLKYQNIKDPEEAEKFIESIIEELSSMMV